MKRFIIISGTNGIEGEPPDLEIDTTIDNEEEAISYAREGVLIVDTLENRQGCLVTTYEKLLPCDEPDPYNPYKLYPTTRRVVTFVWDDIEQEQEQS